jgi:hypothetical protein
MKPEQTIEEESKHKPLNIPDLTPVIRQDPRTGKPIYMYSFQAYEYWNNLNRDKLFRNKGQGESIFTATVGCGGHRASRHGIGD